MDKSEVIALAGFRAQAMAREAAKQPRTRWTFEYSPKPSVSPNRNSRSKFVSACSMSGNRRPNIRRFSICRQRSSDHAQCLCRSDRVVLAGHISRRDSVIISVHPHNDRGTGVAATELRRARWRGTAWRAVCSAMANARAMSIWSLWRSISTPRASIQSCVLTICARSCAPSNIAMPCPSTRAILTPASWSSPPFQDLTRTLFVQGFAAHETRNDGYYGNALSAASIPPTWEATYEAVIRVNSQSGKGGIAWILRTGSRPAIATAPADGFQPQKRAGHS